MSRWQRGELLGGMTAQANAPGNPNPQTTGSFNQAGNAGSAATSATGSGDSAKSNAQSDQNGSDAQGTSGAR